MSSQATPSDTPSNEGTPGTPQTTPAGTGNGSETSQRNGQPNQNNRNSGSGGNRNNRGGRTRPNGRPARTATPSFKGNTAEMNGNVFQCYAETTNKHQYQDTVTALSEYITKNLKHARDVVSICQTGEVKDIEIPKDLAEEDKTSEAKKLIFKARIDAYVTRTDLQKSNMQTIYSVIWGQCSHSMQAKLRSLPEFDEKDEEWDCTWLLKEVKKITHMFEGTRNPYLSIDDAMSNYEHCRQGQNENVHEFMKRFRNCVEVLEHYGANVGHHTSLVENEQIEGKTVPPEGTSTEEIVAFVKQQKRKARDKSIAMAFLKRADRRRYGTLWQDLMNLYARGQNQYPTDLTSAYNLLVNYHTPQNTGSGSGSRNRTADEPGNEIVGMNFLQQDDLTPGTDGVTYEEITCFRCRKRGHYRGQCPFPENQQGVTCLQVHDCAANEDTGGEWPNFSFAQNTHAVIPSHWILLDSQSTVSIFKTKRFLHNIRPSHTPLKVRTNGGTQVSTLVGDVTNFGEVWYNPQSLANILSMAAVRKVCRITMDTAVEPALFVHRKDGTTMKFVEFESGLYYFDASKPIATPNPSSSATVSAYPHDYIFINTVAENKALYTRREVELADVARSLFRKLDCPSYPRFEHYVKHNLIRNCPITVDDIHRSLHIYGPDPAALKGKTVNRGSQHVNTFNPERPPAPILHVHQNITLCVDILYINGIMFITTVSRRVKFRTIAHINNRSKATLLREVQATVRLYEARGFTVVDVHADQEFACIANELHPARVNIANADDHVPEVERSIRTIKERVRAGVQTMPFRRLPKLMIKALAEKAVRSLNQFPAQDGMSRTMSPLTIMTGRGNPDYNNMQLEFGSYAQVFEANDPTNTTKARMTGAITLQSSDNEQGGFYFMSLTTGRRLSRLQWQALPMPAEVITRVEHLAELEGQRLMANHAPLFELAPGFEMRDDDEQMLLPGEEVNAEPEDPELLENHIADGDEGAQDEDPMEQDDVSLGSALNDEDSRAESGAPEGDIDDEPHEENDPYDAQHVPEEADLPDHIEPEATAATYDDINEEATHRREGLRPNRERSYAHRLDHQMDEPENGQSYQHVQFAQWSELREDIGSKTITELKQFITGFIMTQMTATAGIKKHGELAIEALFKEFSQLDTKVVFEAVMASDLTDEQKKGALRAINLIKEKRTGTLKGRTCADGSKQRDLYSKEETASPTVSNDSLMVTHVIDGKERRDVGCADVTGAYLNADMDVFTLLKLTGQAVEIMCTVNPEYKRFVTTENGRPVLYLRLLKALYGCVRSALLWYELFSSTLTDLGFELNPYDPCVANKMINGHQCTIVWYVDDNKISHKDPNVVSTVIRQIEKKFGKMTVTRGKKHTFLGTDVTYNDDGTVTLKMKSYLEEAIEAYGEPIKRKASTPARRTLLEIDEESPRLDEARAETFHSIVAKLLYVSKRGRLDIQLPIAFLCTRVSRSTEQDWDKLRRVLEYLNGTLDDELILGADDLAVMNTWVDVSYATHADMKSHTGAGVSFGRGTLMSKSSKQKLNTKSSTEAELVGASDYLTDAIWLKKFLSAQGYELKTNTFHQDNQSAIKLAQNGRVSAGKKSRHIDIRYFFIKDRLKQENITVQYCPTESMLADFFTKPLQGALFRKLKAVVMGHVHTSVLTGDDGDTSNQERVGKQSGRDPTENGIARDPDVTDETAFNGSQGAKETNAKTYADVVKGCQKDIILFD